MQTRRQLLQTMASMVGGSVLLPLNSSASAAESEEKAKEEVMAESSVGARDSSKIGSVTRRVAEWATKVKYEDIPPEVIRYEKMILLDGIGCAILGSTSQSADRVTGYPFTPRLCQP
jgi:MmgE/PrpD N-terminal domain